jgi:hypothetical protein
MTFLVSGPLPSHCHRGKAVPRGNAGLDHTVGTPGRLTYSCMGSAGTSVVRLPCCRGAGKDDTGYSALGLDLVFLSDRVNVAALKALNPRDLTCRQTWYRSPARPRRAISIPAPY